VIACVDKTLRFAGFWVRFCTSVYVYLSFEGVFLTGAAAVFQFFCSVLGLCCGVLFLLWCILGVRRYWSLPVM